MVQDLEERTEQMLIVGKNSELEKGPIFHKVDAFFLAVTRPRDETRTAYIIPVSGDTYQQHSVGDSIDVPQYSVNGRNWYFSTKEAEKFTPY